MISVSQIKEHMYCGMKLYHSIRDTCDKSENIERSLEIKKLKIDIENTVEKNIRKVKKDMTTDEIEMILENGIGQITQDSEIRSTADFKIKILSFKLSQAMKTYDKNAIELESIFFPNRLYSYSMKDEMLELSGVCDKVEISEGKYYPVLTKSSTPPFRGVWDSDAIELAAHSMLLENEFDSDVYAGFVDYEKIGERRVVIMDVALRKSLFKVMNEIRDITENGNMPHVKKSFKKCEKCEYRKYCID